MKKVFLFAVAAAALVACSNEELSTPDNALVSKEAPVNFSVYTQRGLTRAGGQTGDLTNENIGANGFGVFAYYTAGEQYDAKATPNFMYNQQVTCSGTATAGTLWSYEPVKYWPNEYGNDATSDETDYLTFFAYAPWTNIDPTTGNIIPKTGTGVTETAEHQQKYNIISVNKNTATGDPIVKYVVDTDPATSVDLLWGVAAADAANQYSPITGNNPVAEGLPFINLVKPNKPASDRMQFNLKHALAKLKVTIDYIADAETPGGTSADIDATTTRIYVRNFKMSGFATKGALNLNNTAAGEPLWKDFDGAKDLAFDDVIYQDGRKDGKEGETNGAQTNETPQGLNPMIIENYCQPKNNKFDTDKNPGVTKTPQNLFGGDETANGGYFYVIPRNEASGKVDLQIAYDVETIDPALAGKLSDGETHGISIENVISKSNIFNDLDFKAGYVYEIKIHLGMTSVKVEATVTQWTDNQTNHIDAELPANQNTASNGNANVGGNPSQMVSDAFGYVYTPAYQYKGTATADGNNITYTPTGADAQEAAVNMMNDLARFLGGLYRASGVKGINYNNVDYIWDETAAGNLKGSNWYGNNATLVSAITAAYNSQPFTTLTLDITDANNEPETITFTIAQP